MLSLLKKWSEEIKMVIRKIYYKFKIDQLLSRLDRIFWKPYKLMNAKETIDFIIERKCSIARFGDGELNIAAYGCSLGFQKEDVRLQKRLVEVMKNEDEDLLLCLPYWAGWSNLLDKEKLEKLGPIHKRGVENNLHDWLRFFSRKRIYGDAHISRVIDIEHFNTRKEQIDYTKRIWDNRHVVIVEGEKTRFGVGNDLLDNAQSVIRILGPAESAFDYLDDLLIACKQECLKITEPLVLLALGPTATVMASDLQKMNIQAIDIGHLDIVYEVSLHNIEIGGSNQDIPVPRKYAVPGKYTNEAVEGNIVGTCEDPNYLAQIVYRY